MKVIIVGGGIGGLTTALMLHARGIDCELFEQSEGIRELGVGINTLPHAIKELQQLGLMERLDAVAIRTHELIYTNRFGQEIWREPRGIDAGYDVPQFSVHRGRLQGVIHQAVRSRLGESRLHTGHRLGAFTQDESGVTAYFFDRNGSHRAHRARRRADRRRRHPFVCARHALSERRPGALERLDAVARRDRLAEVPHRPLDGDRRRHGGQARGLSDRRGRPRGPAADQLGGAGEGRRGRRAARTRKTGRSVGRFEDLMPHVQRFRIPYVDAKALIEATPEFWEYPMCDRDPLPRWTHGRVTLLGDAAHPMYPVGSNGASQAILDARCLADRLVSAEHPVHALWQYEQERLPPTAQIVKMNRGGGPEGVIDAVEQRAPDGFTNIDDVLPFEQRKAIVRGYAGAAGFAQSQVNKPAGKAA